MVPSICLSVGAQTARVEGRSSGSLTGSRVAGALGRIPVMSVLDKRAPLWANCGFQAASALTVATYVDNIYSVSGSVLGAVDILEDVERHLASDWGLQIKSSSRSVLTAAGRAIPDGHDAMKWPVQDIFPVLGHRLDSRGSSWPCWERTKQSMWGAFYRTCGAQGYKQLPHKLQNRTLNRCILPILEYRCTRWSYQETLAEDIDRVQRKMFSILAKVPRQAGENDDTYFRRRRRQVSVTCKTHGLWSIRFAERICKWDAHLCRPANRNSWAAKLLQWQGREWLAIRRARFTSGTCTRLQPGTPCPRWHDGVASAHAALERRAG